MTIEIFTIVKNGEYILPLYLEHYRKNFPDCVINIFDNNSTDKTVSLCKNAGCIVKRFPEFDLSKQQYLNNNVWKSSTADWVIVCDVDELAQINQSDIENLNPDINVIQFRGYNMLDVYNDKDPKLFNHGFPSPAYDKCLMFKPTLKEIGYMHGAHLVDPKPNPVYSKLQYKMYHYNKSWFTLNNFIAKHSLTSVRDLKTVYNLALKDKVSL